MEINNLQNWNEVTKGLYRFVIAAGACYEIHLLRHEHNTPIEDATATLFIVGDWFEGTTSKDVFTREALVVEQPVSICLAGAHQDYLSNVDQ